MNDEDPNGPSFDDPLHDYYVSQMDMTAVVCSEPLDCTVLSMTQVPRVPSVPLGPGQSDGEVQLLLGNQTAGILTTPACPERSWLEEVNIIESHQIAGR